MDHLRESTPAVAEAHAESPWLDRCLWVLLPLPLLVEAWRKSFWLDEMHTLDVAWADSMVGVLDRIRPDFHAPLYFLAAHLLPRDLGHAARLLSVLGWLLTIWPLTALARESGLGPPARRVVMAAMALLPFQIQYGAEFRPYAWLGLAAAVMAWATFSSRGAAKTRWFVFVAAATFGLYTHYLACAAILGCGGARLIVRPPGSLRWSTVVAAGTCAVLLFLPWIAWDESWLLEDPGVMVRNEAVDEAADGETAPPHARLPFSRHVPELAGLVPRTLAPMVTSLGAGSAWCVRIALLALAAGLVGTAFMGTRAPGGERAPPLRRTPLAGAAVAAVLGLAIVALGSVWIWERVAIQYFTVGGWVWPVVFGLAVEFVGRRTSRRLATRFTVLLSLALALAAAGHLSGASRENMRRGVQVLLEESTRHGGICTAVLRQPPHYRHEIPLLFYGMQTIHGAGTIDGGRTVGRAPRDVPPGAALASVWVMTRGIDATESSLEDPDWQKIRSGRIVLSRIPIDTSITVWHFGITPDSRPSSRVAPK